MEDDYFAQVQEAERRLSDFKTSGAQRDIEDAQQAYDEISPHGLSGPQRTELGTLGDKIDKGWQFFNSHQFGPVKPSE